jgi:hypothetical protein
MLAVSFLQWWYSRGWGIFLRGFRDRMRNLADFFSIGLLLKTLFQPFRQISANETGETGGLEGSLIAFFDRLLSRVIGFLVRTGVIIFGIIAMIFQLTIGIALVVVWPCVPLLPFAGIVVSSMGIAF